MDEIDTNWIEEYEKKEQEYDFFYKDTVDNIQLYFLYVNLDNEILKVSKETLELNNNFLTKEELVHIIKKNEIDKDISYKLTGLLKYNITLDPENIEEFAAISTYNENFLESLKDIHDLHFKDTITIFQNMNGLYFIYQEKAKKLKSNTKKIYLEKSHRRTKKSNLKIV
jgi:hypothetical protein